MTSIIESAYSEAKVTEKFQLQRPDSKLSVSKEDVVFIIRRYGIGSSLLCMIKALFVEINKETFAWSFSVIFSESVLCKCPHYVPSIKLNQNKYVVYAIKILMEIDFALFFLMVSV